jgi:hypothetical protein
MGGGLSASASPNLSERAGEGRGAGSYAFPFNSYNAASASRGLI